MADTPLVDQISKIIEDLVPKVVRRRVEFHIIPVVVFIHPVTLEKHVLETPATKMLEEDAEKSPPTK